MALNGYIFVKENEFFNGQPLFAQQKQTKELKFQLENKKQYL